MIHVEDGSINILKNTCHRHIRHYIKYHRGRASPQEFLCLFGISDWRCHYLLWIYLSQSVYTKIEKNLQNRGFVGEKAILLCCKSLKVNLDNESNQPF
jgi:hypothetical protein